MSNQGSSWKAPSPQGSKYTDLLPQPPAPTAPTAPTAPRRAPDAQPTPATPPRGFNSTSARRASVSAPRPVIPASPSNSRASGGGGGGSSGLSGRRAKDRGNAPTTKFDLAAALVTTRFHLFCLHLFSCRCFMLYALLEDD